MQLSFFKNTVDFIQQYRREKRDFNRQELFAVTARDTCDKRTPERETHDRKIGGVMFYVEIYVYKSLHKGIRNAAHFIRYETAA